MILRSGKTLKIQKNIHWELEEKSQDSRLSHHLYLLERTLAQELILRPKKQITKIKALLSRFVYLTQVSKKNSPSMHFLSRYAFPIKPTENKNTKHMRSSKLPLFNF
jgi:hypothetical protein